MIHYEPGQEVQFNVEFSKGETLVLADALGIVKSDAGNGVFVSCLGRIWMCYWFEIRPDCTAITPEMICLIERHNKLLSDFATWEAGSVSA